MSTESLVWTPFPPEDFDHPPSYDQVQQQQFTRAAFIAIPVDELPPPYETVCSKECHQVSPPTPEQFPNHECASQTVNNTNNYNTSARWSCTSTSRIIYSEKRRRQEFARNVYGIVSAQLLTITVIMSVCLLIFSKNKATSITSIEQIFCNVPLLSFTLISCSGYCCLVLTKSLAKIVCLVVNTLSLGFFLAFLSDVVGTKTTLLSVVITTIACVSLTVLTTHWNLSTCACGGILLFLGVIVVNLVIFAFPVLSNVYSFSHVACACLVALIFSTFLVSYTRLLLIGKHSESASISWETYASAVNTFLGDLIRMIGFLVLIVIMIIQGRLFLR